MRKWTHLFPEQKNTLTGDGGKAQNYSRLGQRGKGK